MGIILIRRLFFLLFVLFSFCFAQDNEACLECHSDQSLTKTIHDTIEVSLYVDDAMLQKSTHAGFGCVDCHSITVNHPDDLPRPKAACASCHEDAQLEYHNSIHGQALAKGSAAAASCADCHGSHDILPKDDPKSKIYHANLSFTCGVCHSRPDIIHLFGRRNIDRVATYQNSVHGKKIKEDPTAKVATCTDCHGSHSIFPMVNPKAKLNEFNIAETCGQCHSQMKDEYLQSIHWNSLQRGHYESPNCTDCHGEHEIEHVATRGEFGNGRLASTRVCANCHSSETLMSRFGLDHKRLDSYMKSYHGLAVLKDSPEAAICTSCHETHAIRSKQDTLSSVNASNLTHTCSKCHTDVTESFSHIDVHPREQKARNPVAYFFKLFYTWMIILVIGGMFIHNLIIFVYHIREKRRAEKNTRRLQRFQPFEVYQHMFMFLSFGTLVVTGFSLKFPDAGWVKLLLAIGMDEVFRSVLHRIAAVVMIAVSTIQLGYFLFTGKGRKEMLALLPNGNDLLHFWQNMRFYLGLSKTRPEFDRYDYGEKAEYLALIWGVIIMGASGFVLWFPEFFIGFLPSWLFETSEVIHYYEAWLATLAILIWHWFFVIFHPEKYPVNTTFLDGTISEEDLKHHHPKEYLEYLKNKQSGING